MPAYKVPCPHCGQFIMRDVAVCPFCRTADPFAPARCTNCRAVLEDPRWSVCPNCGTEVVRPAAAAPAQAAAPGSPAPLAATEARPAASTAAAPSSACRTCSAPLAAGARFCTVCGTIV
jgi:RNA polymerase subunit RPABC4/transcription elongation factor Spt4